MSTRSSAHISSHTCARRNLNLDLNVMSSKSSIVTCALPVVCLRMRGMDVVSIAIVASPIAPSSRGESGMALSGERARSMCICLR